MTDTAKSLEQALQSLAALQSRVDQGLTQGEMLMEKNDLLIQKADLTIQTLGGLFEMLSAANAELVALQQRVAQLSLDTGANFAQLSQNTAIAVGAIAGAQAPAAVPALVAPDKAMPLDAVARRVREDYPRLYPLWDERLQAMKDAFVAHGRPGNAAHGGDPAANYFRNFVLANHRGRTLDVGCGVHGKPYYLIDIDSARLAGLDPLNPIQPVDFTLATGVGEYIPWADASFETVVSGTSLDHCIDIDRTLAEFGRVMAPGGNLLIWMANMPGAKEFAPDDPDWTPEDEFHLYHPDESWFEPRLTARFEIRQKVKFYAQSFEHCFYELVALPARAD